MAVAGLITQSISAEYTYPSGVIPLVHAPEGASQSFLKGAPVIYSSGKIVVGASPPFDTGDALAGIAQQDASGVTDRDMCFVPAHRNVVFEGTLESSSSNGYALLQADLGAIYAIDYDATNKKYYVDKANTTNAVARIIRLVDPVGTVRGRVQFVFTGGIMY